MLDNMRSIHSFRGGRQFRFLLGVANAASAIYASLVVYPPLSLVVSLASIIILIYAVAPKNSPLTIDSKFAYTSVLISAITVLIILAVR